MKGTGTGLEKARLRRDSCGPATYPASRTRCCSCTHRSHWLIRHTEANYRTVLSTTRPPGTTPAAQHSAMHSRLPATHGRSPSVRRIQMEMDRPMGSNWATHAAYGRKATRPHIPMISQSLVTPVARHHEPCQTTVMHRRPHHLCRLRLLRRHRHLPLRLLPQWSRTGTQHARLRHRPHRRLRRLRCPHLLHQAARRPLRRPAPSMVTRSGRFLQSLARSIHLTVNQFGRHCFERIRARLTHLSRLRREA